MGGYQIVNLKNVPLASGEGETIPGTYAAVSNGNRKPALVTGLVIGAVEYPDEYCAFRDTNGDGSMVANLANGGTITITNADLVTYATTD